jgi:zinc D-Ala-D-Ala dipeptidase
VSRAGVNPVRIEDIAAHASFRRLDTIAGIAVDLRYAGSNNFDGRVLYQGIDCAWLRVEAARGLETSAAWLAAHHPGQSLLVLDALRPQRVQEAIWRDVQGTTAQIYFADPARGSIHSFGMAVDVTLQGLRGGEVDMGSGFDEMSQRSHPALEAEQLAAGAITREHIAAREVLRAAMHHGGFRGIATEWWHFNHGDPRQVRLHLPRVL